MRCDQMPTKDHAANDAPPCEWVDEGHKWSMDTPAFRVAVWKEEATITGTRLYGISFGPMGGDDIEGRELMDVEELKSYALTKAIRTIRRTNRRINDTLTALGDAS